MIIGIDFESYYDKEYSLSKMPTHAYIRDERWRCLGCGFWFLEDSGPLPEPFYTEYPDSIFASIDDYGWDRVTLVAHNASFDGSVLYERFGGRKPGRWLDTQLIARWAIAQGHMPPEQGVSLAKLAPLVGMTKGNTWDAVHGGGEKLATYGTEDVRIMMALLKLFLKWEPSRDELDYMDMHIRMMTEPKLVTDRDKLTQATIITPEQEALSKQLRKDENMAYLLEHYGVEPEYKTTPKGKRKLALAKTDAFMQGLVKHENPKVAELASLRLDANSNITRTRALTLLRVGDPLPFPVLYYGAHTGRGSGIDNYNMQNMPAGGILRESIEAPPGYKLVVGDSSQIEPRCLGWAAGEERLLEIFREADATDDPGRDAYRLFGGEYMYNMAPEELTDFQRKVAKAGLLGLGYAQGWRGLQEGSRMKGGLIIPDDEAKHAVNVYRSGFKRVRQWWHRLKRWALEDGYVELPDGRIVIYPDLREDYFPNKDGELELTTVFDRPLIFSKGPKGKRQTCKFWHGVVVENHNQAFARSVVFWQVKKMREEGVLVLGMSHDEAISMATVADAERVKQTMEYWFRQAPPFAEGLPTNGKVVIGDNYAECK